MQLPAPRPLIALTTDFGLADHYVGVMKAVILSRCPDARLVDVSHQLTAYSLYAAAYTVDQAARAFPPGTVHLVVVDPGVGTARRAITAETGGQWFVAPDNGVLSLVLSRTGAGRIWDLANRSLFLPSTSATFHGRDIFAPIAAALAGGTNGDDLGPRIDNPVILPNLRPQAISERWQGLVLSVDRFGNVITNFESDAFASYLGTGAVTVGSYAIRAHYRTFGEAPAGQLFLYRGSSGYLEIGINQANAAGQLGVRAGDVISLGR